MRILAIETSCDETAASIVEAVNYRPVIRTNVVASQIDIHAKSGGVIPNVAARMHAEALPAVLNEATNNKKIDFDAVAVTAGPGLVGCLLVGMSAAKTIAAARGIPYFAINHLEGHVYSAWIESTPDLPALIVIVSGGHTELVLMKRHGLYELLGSTRDDAIGEAFDKVARLLDLPYPGGPALSELAAHGDENAFELPVPLRHEDSLEFSYSGLKGAVSQLISKLPQPLPRHARADVAASFQKTAVDAVTARVKQALHLFPGIQSVCLVGGVAANKHLRTQLEQTVHASAPSTRFFVPDFRYCTDNAAMIGAAAVYRHLFGHPDSWYDSQADPNLPLAQ